jgi:tRNA pseudouridine38-40 synthase
VEKDIRIALKLAYDGTRFFGFQRQPGKETVEGTLITALSKIGAIKSSRECGYRSSSRTDRGVSALGNIVSLNTSFPVSSICAALNSEMEDVWAYSAVAVDGDFNPRGAKQRWYRYYLARTDQDEGMIRELSQRFVGIHDFSSYARTDKRNPMRKIDSIAVKRAGIFFEIDFRAESFLWNMVRRIVWVLNEASSGRLDPETVGPDSVRKPSRVGLALPDYLILVDIDCGLRFPVDSRAAIGISRRLERRVRASAVQLAFYESLLETVSDAAKQL